ncbi:response regulator [Rugamonas sp.]|uniref:response regulator n=1 Tax=Rugamonas sp. TaxID=1926287 RepID=UPI0025E0BB43|nr:response regulator [Rugamonas sp.]
MGARILIVEDNQASMELLVYLLGAYGHQPLQAHDGEQGVALALRELPDLIICDLQLPKLDGYGVVQRLKGEAATRAIPILAASAQAVNDGGAALRAAGFDGSLAKSFDPLEMLPALDAFLPAALRAGDAPPVAAAVPVADDGAAEGSNDVNRINNINDMDDAMDAAAAAPAAPRFQASGARILLLDAAPDDCGLVASVLLHFGYALTVASDAAQAEQATAVQQYDLLLCDLDPFHALRSGFPGAALQMHGGLPVIVLRPDPDDDVSALLGPAAPTACLLEHPIEPQQLVDAIGHSLAARRQAA